MYYILDGKTLDLENLNADEIISLIKYKFEFVYDFLYLGQKQQIVADLEVCKKILENTMIQDVVSSSNDYDLIYYWYFLLDAIICPDKLDNLKLGNETDFYCDGVVEVKGENFSCEELCYENKAIAVKFCDIHIEDLVKKITKNSQETREVFQVTCVTEYYLVKSVFSSAFLVDFFTSFSCVKCLKNSRIEDWDSVTEKERRRILSTFYKEIKYIVSGQFHMLGRPPGKRGERIVKIPEVIHNCYEYRILNPNFRIYFLLETGQVIVLIGRLKSENSLTEAVKQRIRSIASVG